jgi:hypothetical protein
MVKIQRGESFINKEARKVVNVVSPLLTDTLNAVICDYGHSHNSMTYALICNEEFAMRRSVMENIKKGLYRQEEIL